ncbi:hypothetical protein Q9Q94_06575 [Uliginosibacterium sp. 31-16]|uniref:hypothetical protein n=1 Tax=Uliginosibacterium sp. 31-16 TaxID=3068315 RepID=UPI00273E20FA|nr:hypothetical protein [Uliginosibacterium sp. 31-16]MDP5239185.1 hypothetical protein [Uliginosibacterium sp. 31-16]
MSRPLVYGSGLLLLLISLATGAATSSSSSGGSAQPPGPPPEAVAACKGKTEGSEVSFTGRKGETFTGICQTSNGTLAAAPKGGRPGGNGSPPPAPR